MSTDRGNPKRLETLIINAEDEQVPSLINPMTGQMLIINPVGKRIIELADGSLDVEAIATQIVKEFPGARMPDVLQHTEAFLAEGARKGVLKWTGQN